MAFNDIIAFLYQALFGIDSIWSIVVRAVLWFAVSIVIIMSLDKPDPAKSLTSLKSNLGFFFFFVILTGGLIFLLFSYTS